MPTGVYVKTEEHKRKISDTLKRKGIKPPSQKGVKQSQATIQKRKKTFKKIDMSWWKIGKKFTKEHKRKISEALKGKVTWNKGIPQTKEWREKQSKLMRGANGPGWKGGINPINDTIRKSLKYRLWRGKVFKRDNYTCQKTRVRGGRLVPHHILNFAKYPKLRFKINNGITLSKKAHNQFHKKYGRENNTRKQLKDFLKN